MSRQNAMRRTWRVLVVGDGIGSSAQQTGAERQALALAAAMLKQSAQVGFGDSRGWSVKTESLAAVQHPMPRLFRPTPTGIYGAAFQAAGFAYMLNPSVCSSLTRSSYLSGLDLPEPFSNPGDFSTTLVIAAGSGPSAASVAIRKQLSGSKLIQVLNPRRSLQLFDVVVGPGHDWAPDSKIPDNVVLTDGSIHDITPDRLAVHAEKHQYPDLASLARPRVSVLLGGPRGRRARSQQWSMEKATEMACSLDPVIGENGSVIICASRRTPLDFTIRLENELVERHGHSRVLFDDGGARGRYLYLLASSDALVITADSVNMMSEAAGTSARVYVHGSSGSHRLDRFRDSLFARDLAHPLSSAHGSSKMDSASSHSTEEQGLKSILMESVADRTASAVWKRLESAC